MKLERILPFARKILESAVSEGDIVVDATVGNGHDTLFLARLVGKSGKVYGFDIQKEAIDTTRDRLQEHEMSDQVLLFQKGHEHVLDFIPPLHHQKITGAIFNLGYLPGGDKSIVTRPKTTIEAVEHLLSVMPSEAVIVLVIYPGHLDGAVERDYIIRYVEKLNQQFVHVLRYQFINQTNNPPFIIALEKI